MQQVAVDSIAAPAPSAAGADEHATAAPVHNNYGVDPALFMQRYERNAAKMQAHRAAVLADIESGREYEPEPMHIARRRGEDGTGNKILGQLEENSDGLTVKELAQGTGLRRTTVQSALERLYAEGDVTGGGRGQKWRTTWRS